ncbi:hypothetical protein QAD02_000460 [Eretmocerus hayati]|uniref:Uncharacterized protein n=2 Tax=Eretmocerus hayati TaxID=131215 RepID=A0ACC2NDN9_9HYME|nr:hypothetical protein QAD02_000459 [Eretmocerus hayati]KAJ8669201.1 hypothetical protein QAD02_000460 [Eretmocerus hayati]
MIMVINVWGLSGFKMELMQSIVDNTSIAIILRQIRNAADLSFMDDRGYTYLIQAIEKERLIVVYALLAAGADPNQKGDMIGPFNDPRPIYFAIARMNFQVVKTLISVGADLVSENRLCLHAAVIQGSTRMIRLLTSKGARYTAYDELNRSPLDMCLDVMEFPWISPDDACEMLEYMLQHGGSVTLLRSFPFVPRVVYQHGSLRVLELLLSAGLMVNRTCYFSMWRTLLTCIFNDRKEILKYMIYEEAQNVNVHDNLLITPLMLAAELGKLRHVKIMVKAGAQVNAKDRFDESALTKSMDSFTGRDKFDYLIKISELPTIKAAYEFAYVRNRKIFLEKFIKYVALQKRLNSAFDTSAFLDNRSDFIKETYDSACAELSNLEQNYIYGTVNLFRILTLTKYAKIALNNDVSNYVKNSNLKERFPMYGEDLVANVTKAKKYQDLVLRATEKLRIILGNNLSNTPHILDMIIQYLNTPQLRKIAFD